MDPLTNLPGWHRELSANDFVTWRAWANMTGIYSPEWTEAYLEAQNISGPATRRQLRRMRQGRGPMRILVNVYDRRPGVPNPDGSADVVDACEVYGWRAALTAIRALRDEWMAGPMGRARHTIGVLDARLSDAVDLTLYGE